MKTDYKNYKLIELVAQLPDHIDMHRIIGLNVRALHQTRIKAVLCSGTCRSWRRSRSPCTSARFTSPRRGTS